MDQYLLYAANLVAILILTMGLYFPRHRRRDLVAAYIGVNVGVMAVSTILLNSAVGAGLGLGLFGVLSIIRLRSDELAQHEVAYYFSALALGLIAGLGLSPWHSMALMALILVGMFVADNPAVLRGYTREVVVLDRAVVDPVELLELVKARLGGSGHHLSVTKHDFVADTTTVDVRYKMAVAK